MPIKGIIFDRDNTLLYFDQQKTLELKKLFFKLAPKVDFWKLMEYWEIRNGALPKSIEEENNFWEDFWGKEIPQQFGLEKQDTLNLIHAVPFYYKVFSVFPETIEVLEKLKNKSIKLAILTNFELPNVRQSLIESNVDPDIFDQNLLINKSMIDFEKPDPRSYKAVLEIMKLTPQEVLFIDDDKNNIVGAQSLGIKSLLIDRDAAQISDNSINNLGELFEYI